MKDNKARLYKVVLKRIEFSTQKSPNSGPLSWNEHYRWRYTTIEKELEPLILEVLAYNAKDAVNQTQIITLDSPFGLNADMQNEKRPAVMHFIVAVEPAAPPATEESK